MTIYIVEVTNRFKGLELIDRLPEELWTEVHDIVQETRIKIILKKESVLFGERKIDIFVH